MGESGSELVIKVLKLFKRAVDVPLEVTQHLSLHLVDLLEREHGLSDDTPTLIGVGIVAEVLGSHHESSDEETMSRRALSLRVSSFQPREKEESRGGD